MFVQVCTKKESLLEQFTFKQTELGEWSPSNYVGWNHGQF